MNLTPKEFTSTCVRDATGILRLAALHAYETGQCEAFVKELIEQIIDKKSQSSLHRSLGSTLYGELLELSKTDVGLLSRMY